MPFSREQLLQNNTPGLPVRKQCVDLSPEKNTTSFAGQFHKKRRIIIDPIASDSFSFDDGVLLADAGDRVFASHVCAKSEAI